MWKTEVFLSGQSKPARELNMAKRVLTTFEAGEYCGVNPYTIRNWIEQKKLKAYTTPGGHRRIRKSDLDEFLKKHGMPVPEEFHSGKKRVLIVDDDSDVLIAITNAIAGISDQIAIKNAKDGFTAGKFIHTFDPDLVFLDLKMPGMNGFDVCKQIKEDPETAHIKVVGMTGYATTENVEKILECGAIDILSKPISLKNLKEILTDLLGSTVEKKSKQHLKSSGKR